MVKLLAAKIGFKGTSCSNKILQAAKLDSAEAPGSVVNMQSHL